MNSVKDFDTRKYVVGGIVVFLAVVFLSKLFYLQVIDDSAKLSADNNVIRQVTLYPSRGQMFDRNNTLLVYNKAGYDIMVIPREVKAFDTLAFCRYIQIEKDYLVSQLALATKYSRHKASIFLSQLSAKDYGYLQEELYRFSGFYVRQRTMRAYTSPNASHVLGYIGEVSNRNIEKDAYYKSGDYIGKNGIEQVYEKELRGVTGKNLQMVDAYGRVVGPYKDGLYDASTVPGKNLQLSLDLKLQAYAEYLMQNKLGSVVAIEPSTGEILALVSTPEYDLSDLVGRQRSINYSLLANDTLKPLVNRAISGTYSPGSTFKLVNASIALQEKAITRNTKFACNGRQSYPTKCTHNHITPLNVLTAIETSCNPFFWKTFQSIMENSHIASSQDGLSLWVDYVKKFGFGKPLGIDLPNEKGGNVPTSDFYNRFYGGTWWKAITVRSLAIGQGELLLTPLQMANEVATIANRGHYFVPHMVKYIGGEKVTDSLYTKAHVVPVDKSNLEIVIEAMERVYQGELGTARMYKHPGISMCGKTGTVENPHGEDHSAFVAFAPKDDPKIAICVIVENVGFGSTWAAPIATLMMEKYLTDSIQPKRQWIEDNFLKLNTLKVETHE